MSDAFLSTAFFRFRVPSLLRLLPPSFYLQSRGLEGAALHVASYPYQADSGESLTSAKQQV